MRENGSTRNQKKKIKREARRKKTLRENPGLGARKIAVLDTRTLIREGTRYLGGNYGKKKLETEHNRSVKLQILTGL